MEPVPASRGREQSILSNEGVGVSLSRDHLDINYIIYRLDKEGMKISMRY